jgi:NAD-dependent dihydropyrimidine dehydrogenase PreA subunit
MRIDPEACTACGDCHPYCPTEAISSDDGVGVIDTDLCVECYVCLRSGVCPNQAFVADTLEWPRIIRHVYSAVQPVQSGSGQIDGRGTAEMKTNDVTDRYKHGEAGFTVDIGRPGLGATFADVERIAAAVAQLGVVFEPVNPVTKLMTDVTTGSLREDILSERVLSCILEFKVPEVEAPAVVAALERVAGDIDTVFSVGCISRCRDDGTAPVKAILDRAGVSLRPNGKVNIGLGWRAKSDISS